MFLRGLLPLLTLTLLLCALWSCCSTKDHHQCQGQCAINGHELEVDWQELALPAELANRESEISALARVGDDLILVPQYLSTNKKLKKNKTPKKSQRFNVWHFQTATRQATSIEVLGAERYFQLPGFEGFEAIAIFDRTAYLLIECEQGDVMSSYLTTGELDLVKQTLTLQPDVLVSIPLPLQLANMSNETLVKVGNDGFLVLYEVNGLKANQARGGAQALYYGRDLKLRNHVAMATLEFRTTDATEMDDHNRFWVTNYYWEGDEALVQPVKDFSPLVPSATHFQHPYVERLVELQWDAAAATITPTGQMRYLKLQKESHNWEGLARIKNRLYFVSDKYPTTKLGSFEL